MGNVDRVSFRVEEKTVSAKKTATENFSTILKSGAKAFTDAVVTGVAVAAPFIPGGAGVSAAISGVMAAKDVVMNSTGGSSVSTGSANSMQLSGNGGSSGIIDATRQLQESNQLFSMQYLELQEKMQQENRQFSTISNVIKTRHESAKTAIGNIR